MKPSLPKYCSGILLALSTGAASMAAERWPTLPVSGFIVGHIAVPADVERGDAVFATKSGGVRTGRPAAIAIPQFAYLTDAHGTRIPVVVVQAETAEQGTILGMRDAGGGEHVALREEVTLLGKTHP